MRISFIGSGNVASQLATSLAKLRSIKIVQVISQTKRHAKWLAHQVNAKYSNQIQDLDPETDLIFTAVNDDVITTVANAIPSLKRDQILCHCAGSVPINIFQNSSFNYGCFYPLQTISKSLPVDWDQIPVFITGNNPLVATKLSSLAQLLTEHVEIIDDEQRMALHVAAVFSCNFSNAMYQIGAQLCEANHLPFSYLHPLILETAQKVVNVHPREAQTGPAIRKDKWIMQKHISWLENLKHQKIYQTLSTYIQDQ